MKTVIVQDTDQSIVDILTVALQMEKGVQICHRIKRVYPHLPVIAMSCNSNINDEYNKHGFDDYIPQAFRSG